MKTSFSESVLHQSCGLNRGGQISLWVLDFSGDRAPSGTQKIGNSKRKFYILGTTRNTSLCSFLSKYHLQFSFLMCYHQKFTQRNFCSLDVVLISKVRFASKNNLITQMHPSKGVHKNMLKAWYFTKIKLCHSCIEE